MCGQSYKRFWIFFIAAICAIIIAAVLFFQLSSTADKCPNNYKCVPSSKCNFGDTHSVIYPCGVENKLFCCPQGKEVEQRIVLKTTQFPDKCGEIKEIDRITHGKIADLGQFPWMALLGYEIAALNLTQFFCGGTVISDKYILTAAHCTNDDITIIRVGEHNRTSEIDCKNLGFGEKDCADPHLDFEVEKVIAHKNFNRTSLKNDIALIKVKGKIPYTDFIRPICLPFGNVSLGQTFENENLLVSGWGKSEKESQGTIDLQYAKINVWNILRCNGVVSRDMRPIQDAQICGIGAKAENACNGDSGGPLSHEILEKSSHKSYQIGIVSFGAAKTCENRELPTIYTRVDSYLQWIKENAT